ncbi:MAG: ribonuclease HI family protein [Euryarchaeota archaeon]|nr:ribonuclease HI family protein [Euryarchaeota archaeon]MDE1835068.1 ribonuclease HI family protein [Euryarchaeota archaeon]MDE1879339.1 ribonuclease HI family protein [Euryarchaeota archaeon]MDE2044970.1 ribonuclease HI family protein [Thermoplasmata archaeon]
MASDPAASAAQVVVHFDGACQPPNSSGIATWAFTVEGAGLDREDSGLAAPPFSPGSTNNVAEYTGAIRALEYLLARGYRGPVLVMGDSELVIRQMEGRYQVRKDHLKSLHRRLSALAGQFAPSIRFISVPRERNTRADALTKEAIDKARRALDPPNQ